METTEPTTYTYQQLAGGDIDHLPKAALALATLNETRSRTEQLIAERDQRRTRLNDVSNPIERRRIRKAIDDAKERLFDLSEAKQEAQRHVTEGRREEFALARPAIRAEYARHLASMLEALRAAERAAAAAEEVERVADAYRLASSSIAPTTSPLDEHFVSQARQAVSHWRGVVERALRSYELGDLKRTA
jgi:hypothetical protein